MVGFKGKLVFDTSRLGGAPRKLLDVSVLNKLGWISKIALFTGLVSTYQWFLEHKDDYRDV